MAGGTPVSTPNPSTAVSVSDAKRLRSGTNAGVDAHASRRHPGCLAARPSRGRGVHVQLELDEVLYAAGGAPPPPPPPSPPPPPPCRRPPRGRLAARAMERHINAEGVVDAGPTRWPPCVPWRQGGALGVRRDAGPASALLSSSRAVRLELSMCALSLLPREGRPPRSGWRSRPPRRPCALSKKRGWG